MKKLFEGLIAKDLISKNIVKADVEARLDSVVVEAQRLHATHALVYEQGEFRGYLPLHAAFLGSTQRIFADLLPRPALPTVAEDTPLETLCRMLANSSLDSVGVVDHEGRFLGVVSQNGLLQGLLLESNSRLNQITVLQGRQERLSLIGQMASGMAHDLNNILSAVLGNLELLGRPETSAEARQQQWHIALTAAKDAANVVHRLQNFYRAPGKVELESVDLAELTKEVIQFTRPKWRDEARNLGKSIELEIDLKPVPPVRGNPGDLREVITNLMINAVDAIAEKGVVGVSVAEHEASVVVTVKDSGTGMTEEEKRRCFEPFYSTKVRSENGSGLGLSICNDIVKNHGGRIDFDSTLQVGTEFRVLLPASHESSRGGEREDPLPVRRKVLLVEDEEDVRVVLAEMLRLMDQEVDAVARSQDALQKVQTERYDLVITDQSLPGMNGYLLTRAIRASAPGTPVVMFTGWLSHDAEPVRTADEIPDLVLEKPVTFATLRKVLVEYTRR